MSLLIKALASAEKDKERVKGSPHAQPMTADALTLEPMALDASTGDKNPLDESNVLMHSVSETHAFDDLGLSLAEEAGLLASTDNETKPHVNAKAKSPSNTSKPKSKADAFNEAAMASVAHVKQQAKATKDSQKAAASVFVANHAVKTTNSRSALILLGVAGALIILLGLQGYQYFQALVADEVVVVKPVMPPAPNTEAKDAETIASSVAEGVSSEVVASQTIENQALESGQIAASTEATVVSKESDAVGQRQSVQNVTQPALEKPVSATKADAQVISDTLETDVSQSSPPPKPQKPVRVGARKALQLDEANQRERQGTEVKEPLKLVSKTTVAGVDPTLQAAYEAFSHGDDVSAQQKYRLVLQKDVRNIDALLGMAAIAQRQERNMDAIGWYRKVIEIEPRNSIAQSAMANLEAATDGVGAESKIKSMLARQPDAANLHAALGNLYAAQNQWAAAQAAYFNASQYAPVSADYAFNLAISLEHLGKPKLALVQYQRALELLNMTGAASPDRAQLEARIRALQ